MLRLETEGSQCGCDLMSKLVLKKAIEDYDVKNRVQLQVTETQLLPLGTLSVVILT